MGIKIAVSSLEWVLTEQVGADQEKVYWNSCVMWFMGTVRRRGGVRERRKILGKERKRLSSALTV